jgi:protein arginine N-methyltransferase 3
VRRSLIIAFLPVLPNQERKKGREDKTHKMSISSSDEASDVTDWLDVEPDEELVTYVSLFGPETFDSLEEFLKHCKEQHSFDFADNVRRLQLDFHGAVKLVNFIRSRVAEDGSLPAEISPTDYADDRYLKPVLENDALIFSLDEILENGLNLGVSDCSGENPPQNSLAVRDRDVEAELAAVKEHFANYRQAVEETLDRRWGDENDLTAKESKKHDESDYYFESYAFNGKIYPFRYFAAFMLTPVRYPRNYAEG